MEKTICELFAGVGGFRLGFDRVGSGWKTVWFSQWEPGAKNQWAHDCYVHHFDNLPDINGEYHTGDDIASVDKNTIPDHNLLVGGFPCQDYSVAHPRSSSKGLEGKKGVLWWQIMDVLKARHPSFCLFENVDRLLKSPASQRGRDFGVMLACLASLGYQAEWRVVNAADYGGAQKRKRVFIFAFSKDTKYAETLKGVRADSVFQKIGFMCRAFPIREISDIETIKLPSDIVALSETFRFDFKKAGYMKNGKVWTTDVIEETEDFIPLKDILIENADEQFFINDNEKLLKWLYARTSKKIKRTSKDGHEYTFSEGSMVFPDSWDRPGRTVLTSEGTLNRTSHIVTDPGCGRLRILTPVETERLQGFDDNWTDTGMPLHMRYFCMGNALVVPMITRMGNVLDEIIENEP